MDEQHERSKIAQARVGAVVAGKFVLQRLIGVGGMAAVYAAQHRNGSRVALKVLHGSLQTSAQQRKRLVREAYVANTTAHPGAVRIFDDGVDRDAGAYLVMELLEGATLAELHKRAKDGLPLSLVIAAMDQLLDVLAAAHARGIVHRDIKPANLFVTETGQLKVLDFGIAQVVEHIAGTTLETQRGALLGTPAFMPQEQARGRWDEVDARSDLWAVGATLFTLTSGATVHEGETPNEQLGQAMTVAPRSLAVAAPHLHGDLVRLVDRALRFEPSERWQDARSMQAALRALEGIETLATDALQPLLQTDHASRDLGSLTESSVGPIETLSRAVMTPPRVRARSLVLVALSVAMVLALGSFTFGADAPVAATAVIGPAAQATPPPPARGAHTISFVQDPPPSVSLAEPPQRLAPAEAAAVPAPAPNAKRKDRSKARAPRAAPAAEPAALDPTADELLDLRY